MTSLSVKSKKQPVSRKDSLLLAKTGEDAQHDIRLEHPNSKITSIIDKSNKESSEGLGLSTAITHKVKGKNVGREGGVRKFTKEQELSFVAFWLKFPKLGVTNITNEFNNKKNPNIPKISTTVANRIRDKYPELSNKGRVKTEKLTHKQELDFVAFWLEFKNLGITKISRKFNNKNRGNPDIPEVSIAVVRGIRNKYPELANIGGAMRKASLNNKS